MVVQIKERNMTIEIDFTEPQKTPMMEYILKHKTDTEIYTYYLGHEPKVNKAILSPLREEKNASFSFFRDNAGRLKWKDFAQDTTGDCFDFVAGLFKVELTDALRIVYRDLISPKRQVTIVTKGVVKNTPKEEAGFAMIAIEKQPYTFSEIEYWKTFHISLENLIRYNVSSAKKVWFGDNLTPLKSAFNDPIFAMLFTSVLSDRYKIYRPLAKESYSKHYHNCTPMNVIGLKQLPTIGNVLIITKSIKDVLVIAEQGIPVIAPISETTLIPENIMDDLDRRFKNIYVLYDNDEAGIKASVKMCDKFDLRAMHLPITTKTKDIAEYVKKYGVEKLMWFLLNATRFLTTDFDITESFLTNKISE